MSLWKLGVTFDLHVNILTWYQPPLPTTLLYLQHHLLCHAASSAASAVALEVSAEEGHHG